MKTRSSSGVGQKIDLEFNIDTLRITDLLEDDYNSPGQTAGSTLLNSIKQKTTITAAGEAFSDPTAGVAVPKVQAKVESSKLRELLNNLPGDSEEF
jgi:hypothetical protein